MKVISYKYLDNPTIEYDKYMTASYMQECKEYLKSIKLTGKVAFLYAGGALLTSSEARNANDREDIDLYPLKSGVGVKELAAYSMHRWIGSLVDKDKIAYASINGNTCASSLHSVYEAQELFNKGFDEVIIVSEEKTSFNTKRIFKESMIDLKLGQGVAIIHLSKDGTDITECKWEFEYNRNPFGVTESGYSKILTECPIVSPHGTCTPTNEEAEQKAIGDKEQVRFKEKIGHCQGASGLIEICKILDMKLGKPVQTLASGLGGFYGSCIVNYKG